MRIYVGEDYKGMSRKAANIISAQIILKPDSVMGLATGSTPIGIYDQLVKWYEKVIWIFQVLYQLIWMNTKDYQEIMTKVTDIL